MQKDLFLLGQNILLSDRTKVIGLVFLTLILLILPWLFLGYLSLLINLLYLIALLIYISYIYDLTIPILGTILNRYYFKIKFKIDAITNQAKMDKDFSLIHEITVDDLEAGTVYQVELAGTNKKNEKISKIIPTFATSNDDLPPVIYQVQSSSAINQGKTDTIQTVISWMTNEPSTSKVYYTKGLGKESDLFTSSSQLDLNYTKKHITIITKLEPGAIYRFMVESVDSTNNVTLSKVYTILTPRQQETVFDVIKKNFVDVFGWTSRVGR